MEVSLIAISVVQTSLPEIKFYSGGVDGDTLGRVKLDRDRLDSFDRYKLDGGKFDKIDLRKVWQRKVTIGILVEQKNWVEDKFDRAKSAEDNRLARLKFPQRIFLLEVGLIERSLKYEFDREKFYRDKSANRSWQR